MLLHLCNYVRKTVFLLFFLSITTFLHAQNIKGKVVDANTGEPLVGATVALNNTQSPAIVKLDGTYSFTRLKPGA